MVDGSTIYYPRLTIPEKKGFLIQKVFFMKGQKGGPSEVGFNW
jgi:hypothetical protein